MITFAGLPESMKKGGFLFIVAFLLLASCSDYEKLLKSDDFDLKSERAKAYYNEGDYARALPLLDQLLTVKRGTAEEEEIRYYIAYCYYGQSQFLIASALFKNFFVSFPRSYRAEECLYMSAYSTYQASPRIDLDQTTTIAALEDFQYFIDTYKNSERVEEATSLMDELRMKLEDKMYTGAMLYYDTENYQAAAVTFEGLLKEYPETSRAEDIYLLIIRSYFNFAGNSVPCKRPERYQSVIDSYERFAEQYPKSEILDIAKGLHDRSAELKQKAIKENENFNCDE
jgi:outer membrane protein assembly factor BamD